MGKDAALETDRSPLEAGGGAVASPAATPPSPRLTRHRVYLEDGHAVSVAVAGRGVPFVVVHGFMAEGFIYAQVLSRLVELGYRVVAIDTAGHGGTEVLPEGEVDFDAYVELFSRVVEHLGIRRGVFAGHSMGGRIVAELAAEEPERVVALLLVDAILGRPWDRIVSRARLFPPLLAWLGFVMLADTASTIPVLRDARQARKVLRLLVPTVVRDIRRPWRLVAPAVAILRSGASTTVLDALRRNDVPTVVVHGERDVIVPLAAARDAAERAGAELVVVHGATHSWLIKDPETLPAVVQVLEESTLGDAYDRALREAGLDPKTATVGEVDALFYAPDALVLELTPELESDASGTEHRPARYRFSQVELGVVGPADDGPAASAEPAEPAGSAGGGAADVA